VKVIGSILQWLLTIVALVVAIMALTPEEWRVKIPAWLPFLRPADSSLLAIALVVAMVASGFCLWSRQQVVLWPTRKQWWDNRLSAAIQASGKLVVIDSYQSSKHQFWASIEERLHRDEPFHFIILDLAKTDPMLVHCVNTSLAGASVLDIDARAIKHLLQIRNDAGKGGNKTIEFGYWTGESQGPLVAWTIKGKETIAAGLWQQVDGNTDLSPWLVTRRGPLFQSLKRHYETLIHRARVANNVHSSIAALTGPAGSPPGTAQGIPVGTVSL
jgi:hypothetical protein